MSVRRSAVLILGAGLALAACDDGSSKRMWNRIEAENQAANPPELWSAQVLPPSAPPVTVCADAAMREGFRSMTPQVGGESCVREGSGEKTAQGSAFRCSTPSGARYGVAVAVSGDPATGFTTTSSIHPLQGVGGDLGQTVRYRKLGACPAGWKVGDATDREGRRVSALSR